jgi:hypothetical protein
MPERSGAMNNYPKCFDSQEQYILWRQAARQSSPGQSHICTDCTPEYQKKMVSDKRCAKPLAYFIRLDGELVGKAKWSV